MYHISRWKAESDARNQSSSFNRATKVRERPEEYEIRTVSPNPITRCYSTNIIITVPLQRHIESHIPFRLQYVSGYPMIILVVVIIIIPNMQITETQQHHAGSISRLPKSKSLLFSRSTTDHLNVSIVSLLTLRKLPSPESHKCANIHIHPLHSKQNKYIQHPNWNK